MISAWDNPIFAGMGIPKQYGIQISTQKIDTTQYIYTESTCELGYRHIKDIRI